MTVGNIPVINTWTGNGTNKEFDFDFRINKASELKVYLEEAPDTILVNGTDYKIKDIVDNGEEYPLEDGTIEFPLSGSTYEVLASGKKIVLMLNLAFTQEKSFTQGGITGSAIEECLDDNVRMMQVLKQGVSSIESNVDDTIEAFDDRLEVAEANATSALTKSNTAISTANTASTNAQTALANSTSAVTTANTASTNAQTALTNSSSAVTTANAASDKVDELEEDIEEVIEAAEMINELEEAVETATTKATEATNAATTASSKATEATTAAATATQKAQEATQKLTIVGDVADLATTAKNTTVAAINEVLNTLNTNDGDLTILQTSAKNNLVSAINELVNNKANLIWYANRDFEYKAPNFIAIDKTTITIKAGTAIKLANGSYYYTSIDDEYSISDILDSGTVSNGKDYYFYMNNDKEVIASLSETIPANSVLIGGGHTLCVSVTSSNAPTLLADSLWSSHPAIGYDAGHFIPNTAWTPAFKSGAKTGNKGMALIDFYGIPKFWADIYLQSGTGNATASDYSGTITNSRQCILHQWDMNQVGKKLPTDQQFSIFAEGSNNQTNIAGSAIPSGRLTGGYTDTAGKRMISGFFIECCCGYLWQWGDEIAPVGGSGWASYGDDRRGQSYGMPYVLLFGGNYADSSSCGSWSRNSVDPRSYVYVYSGGRGVSLHIEREHK